jgi:hypothetical protein
MCAKRRSEILRAENGRKSVFHFTAMHFWNSLERPCRRPHSNPQLGCNLPYAEPLRSKLTSSVAVKDPIGTSSQESDC